ncbi:hypothetical protein FHS09_004558 [Microbulbifer rhizosphaerae]|uniref:Uncharacterized protein n=1 Tax=Microbulbifer rhizosphaerae TaxID=1562603 RepID=A0A7W4ZB99_9GAMM|nr:hypothetical protein [Microbulbifer rhizosphaerae]
MLARKPWELGRSAPLLGEITALGLRSTNGSKRTAGHWVVRRNTVPTKVSRRNDQKNCLEKAKQKSELSIVPMKWANRHPPGARGGKGKPTHHNLWRATCKKRRVQTPCPPHF